MDDLAFARTVDDFVITVSPQQPHQPSPFVTHGAGLCGLFRILRVGIAQGTGGPSSSLTFPNPRRALFCFDNHPIIMVGPISQINDLIHNLINY